MHWDATLYDDKHAFVAEYGRALLDFVPQGPALRALDVGCGTGTLTAELARQVGSVLGIDSSADMIRTARADHPDIEFQQMDACALPFEAEFDVVFSNAVFHWIVNQPLLHHGIRRALKPGGRLVCEFGAVGNVQAIGSAWSSALGQRGLSRTTAFYYPTQEAYKDLLRQCGFGEAHVVVYDRPTPLQDGREGLRNWIRQFLAADLRQLPPQEQTVALAEVEEALEPTLWDGQQWIADYRRIRAVAFSK